MYWNIIENKYIVKFFDCEKFDNMKLLYSFYEI